LEKNINMGNDCMWDWVLGSKLLRDLRRTSKLTHTIYEDLYIKLL